MSRRVLVAMGVAGGMVPSPSAVLVLLGAVALGRAWFGLVLVLAYGLGMAATLVCTGLILARARSRIERMVATARGRAVGVFVRGLPAASAGVILLVGLALAARAVAST
jgi:ABC-type nickel/cobalt efflux system permease component RcnA